MRKEGGEGGKSAVGRRVGYSLGERLSILRARE